jgi:DMSO reductase family type II enzyme chaperone
MEAEELREQAAGWRFFHDLLRFPSPEQWAWLHDPTVREAWRLLAGSEELPLPQDLADYEQTYIAAFEVGLPSPPCPLIESHWNKTHPAPQILHENTLYYRRFGLQLRSSANEPADHLRHQLEFLRYLCQLEAEAHEAQDPDHAAQLALARGEYLERHVRSWAPAAAAHLERLGPGEWPAEWLGLLAELVDAAG